MITEKMSYTKKIMDTKVVHHTYPGTMSATELASLQPMPQLKSKSRHQEPGFQSSRDWKERFFFSYIYKYVSMFVCVWILTL